MCNKAKFVCNKAKFARVHVRTVHTYDVWDELDLSVTFGSEGGIATNCVTSAL